MKTSVVLIAVCAAAAHQLPVLGLHPERVTSHVRGAVSRALTGEVTSFENGEFLMDTSRTFVPAPGEQWSPAVAFDGTNFLVVWEDDRCDTNVDVYGSRVTPAGVVLDPAGIAISTMARNQRFPTVAFDGTDYLVVWRDFRNGDSSDIYGARVTPQGNVLDPFGLAVSTMARSQEAPAVAYDGLDFLVVWHDYRNGNSADIYGARLTPQGQVLDPAGIAIARAASQQWDPVVASDGVNSLVVWRDYRNNSPDLYGARVSQQGNLLDPAHIAISTTDNGVFEPTVTFGDTCFLAVWVRLSDLEVCGARITPQGGVLDPDGKVLTTGTQWRGHPAAAYDGSDFLVGWSDNRNGSAYDIYGGRVTPDLVVLDTSGFVVSAATGDQRLLTIAFGGSDFLLTWLDYRDSDTSNVYCARVTAGRTVLDTAGMLVSTAAKGQGCPAVSFVDTNALVVWHDFRNGPASDIYGARVTPAGLVLDPTGTAVSTASNSQTVPAVASNGVISLAVWQDYRNGGASDIYGSRVAANGVILDPMGRAISTATGNQERPVALSDGRDFLVVWQDKRGGTYYDIYGARVTDGGAVLDTAGIAVSTAAKSQTVPTIAFDGTNYFVAWEDERSASHDIYGTRVMPSGAVLDPSGIPVSIALNSQQFPAAAFDGTDFFVVWEDHWSDKTADIYGARITSGGAVIDAAGIAISTATGDQCAPELAFDGRNSLVVWQDFRNGPYSDIWGASVTPAGLVLDSGPVVRQEGAQQHAGLAHGISNQMLMVYQGWAGTIGGKTYNADRIWGKVNPVPGIEEGPRLTGFDLRSTATIVRGLLFLPVAASHRLQDASLLDISGRKVMGLKSGANDVRALAPGVYFVTGEGRGTGDEGRMRKVVVTR